METSGHGDWKRREGLGSALLQIGVVAVLLAAAVAWFVHRGQVRQEVDAHLRTARTAVVRGNPSDLLMAQQQLEALFALEPDQRDARALAADLQTELWLTHHQPGADARAREQLERAEALGSRSGERYGARALQLLGAGKDAEAEKLLEELKAQGANNPRLTLAHAWLSQRQGRLSEARQDFARAAEAAWRDPRFSTAYGEALLDEGMFPQAVEAFARATTANPDHLLARVTSALARLYAGRAPDNAQATLDEVRARPKELTPAIQARVEVAQAELALAKGAPDEALSRVDAALKAWPDEHYALFTRGRALAAKRAPEARQAFEAAVAKRPTAPLLTLEGARLLQAQGDGAGALAMLDAYEKTFREVKARTADGKEMPALDRDDRYWLTRGGVMELAGRQDDALAAYDKALAARGVGLARAQYAKGALLLARKDFDGARVLLTAVAPDTGAGSMPEAYTALGELLFAQGDFAAGCQQHYFALVRARAQGAPVEQLATRANDIKKRLETSGQPAMAKAWLNEAGPLFQRQ
ncbi:MULTISPECIES: tetratricopeptide repeat protein [Corallococcus]|uniref:tetratricopeptide repeat protein n=1 Tax=Corallococcus TaxID=83461 RepID=UPI00117CD3C0|nr:MULTISPECIES: tetratricopeptide repeat protein [Corallococcus]NBD08576.1 tetratricopeptide repeat protein [Corallococcus silvisoli]TSC33174.1 tetratricopeptide repeat protein [Corallococcus sp. Z5C101001]